MINNRYKSSTKRYKRSSKGKSFYKKQLSKILIALVILIIILIIKKINIKFTNKVIRIIDKGIKHEFNVKVEGKKALDFSKKILKVPEKAVSVFNPDSKNKDYISPLEGKIHSSSEKTKGINIQPYEETDVVSIGKGTVTRIEERKDSNYYITVNYEDFEAIYGKLEKVNVSMGDIVFKGEKIGTLGDIDGKEKLLYFEIWKDGHTINPMDIVTIN